MRKIVSFIFVFTFGLMQAQELNCTVTVDAQKLPNSTQQVFKTLQTSLTEFVNKTDWTGQTFKQNEKINCSMYITITSNTSDQFEGTIQVQSDRPIYNATYTSPVFNYNDKVFNFKYTESENLTFNPNAFDSNLVSVIAFYSHIIIGLDADTFVPESGTKYLETAQNIANIAQQGGYKGWSQNDGAQNRYYLINDLLSAKYKELRQATQSFHQGLDLMSDDLKKGKEKIKEAINALTKMSNTVGTNSFLIRVFFDAKSDEIVSIFSGGPSITITDLVDGLNKISPLNSSKWATIKY